MPNNLNLTHAHLRRDYRAPGAAGKKMNAQPMLQFKAWFGDACKMKIPDSNAFVLATADKKSRPSARVLLMKGFNSCGITFFTNYLSAKGRQLQVNPQAEAVFFWNKLNRQVRLSGQVVRISRRKSLAYFRSRPLMAQMTACISDQSRPILNRKLLTHKLSLFKSRLAGTLPALPDDWGGYELRVKAAEFWQGQPNRLHDRFCYKLSAKGRWIQTRLQP